MVIYLLQNYKLKLQLVLYIIMCMHGLQQDLRNQSRRYVVKVIGKIK